jgi:hypothetical protein
MNYAEKLEEWNKIATDIYDKDTYQHGCRETMEACSKYNLEQLEKKQNDFLINLGEDRTNFLAYKQEQNELEHEQSKIIIEEYKRLNDLYLHIMQGIYDRIVPPPQVSFGSWLPNIEFKLCSLAYPEPLDRRWTNKEKKIIIEEVQGKNIDNLTIKLLEDKFKSLSPSQPYVDNSPTQLYDSLTLEQLYNNYKSNKSEENRYYLINKLRTPGIDTSSIPDGEFTPLAKELNIDPQSTAYKTIKKERFKKKHPIVWSLFGKKGGKTKRQRNKKTKRRRNKKTKRRRNYTDQKEK